MSYNGAQVPASQQSVWYEEIRLVRRVTVLTEELGQNVFTFYTHPFGKRAA